MSSLLPIKPSSRALIAEVARGLQPYFSEMSDAWRRKMAEEFAFDQRVLSVLERVNIIAGCKFFCEEDFAAFFENLNYYGTRLAKLQVDTRAVARSLELSLAVCEPYLTPSTEKGRAEWRAALDMLSSATFVTVSGTYYDNQRRESGALLALLDAELLALNLDALLERVLELTRAAFNASLGVVLLRDPETDMLHVKAQHGFDGDLSEDLVVAPGQGFSGRIAQTGEPDMLPDLAHSNGLLNPMLRKKAKALWGVPLKHDDRVIGVLLIGFERRYEWLPTERELMRAIADRSALAIDRARITDALREREARIAELSGHLLKAQEEERKHISRELHDETGQGLMVIRLYLGMLEDTLTGRTAKGKVRETVGVVDRTIEGIRRIIGRLSPLVLQELGLIAAIRKEAKDLAKGMGVKARVAISDDVGRLAPEIEAALYRVVQEALHNVAKHAKAKAVNIQMTREKEQVLLLIEDDGVGITATKSSPRQRQTFGLAGMQERLAVLGGHLRVTSHKGQGTKLEITVPVDQAAAEGVLLPMRPNAAAAHTAPN